MLLPMNTLIVAMNYGFRVSTKGWPVQLSAPRYIATTSEVRIAYQQPAVPGVFAPAWLTVIVPHIESGCALVGTALSV